MVPILIYVPFERLSSGMKRVAPDGEAYDFFDFELWCDDGALATRRWREAPPLDEVLDEREIALERRLTTRSALARDADDEEDVDAVG